MTVGVSVASVIGGGAAAISGAVTLFAWRHRTRWMARPFLILMATLATWSLLYGIQLGFETLAEQLVWQRLTLGVAGFVPPLWMIFVLAYTGREDWLVRDRLVLLLLEPVAFFLLCLTNPYHNLVWTSASLSSTAIGAVPTLEFGLGYAVHIAFAYTMVAAGIGLLVLYGMQVAPTYQKQVSLLVTAAIPPFISHVVFTLGVSPIQYLDFTPFIFAFTGVVLGLALFRFELLKLAPIARNQSLEEVGDGLVIVDNNGVIVDTFGVATDVLDPSPRVGDRISTVFPDTDLQELDGSEWTRNVNDHRRVYQFQVSTLTDPHDRPVGTILIVRDITGLRESTQRLSVSNRVLRHNLRNDMTVVLGYAEQLESRLDGEDARDARKIREAVNEILKMTEKAREITRLRDDNDGLATSIDVDSEVGAIVSELRSEYPNADIRVEASSAVAIDGIDPEAFRLAVRNVLDNAIRHNDARPPRVVATIKQTREMTQIQIADNGPGIPEVEREALESLGETSLSHSQGLGLWITKWCVTNWGGELHLESDTNGSAVTITVPQGQQDANGDPSSGEPAV